LNLNFLSRAGKDPLENVDEVHPSQNNYNHFFDIYNMSATTVVDIKDAEAAEKSTPVLPITVEFT